jgi:hypothetical protein
VTVTLDDLHQALVDGEFKVLGWPAIAVLCLARHQQ